MEPLYPHRRRSIVSECGTTFGTRCTVTFQALVHKRLLDENQELRDRLSDALVSLNELTEEVGDTVSQPWRGGGRVLNMRSVVTCLVIVSHTHRSRGTTPRSESAVIAARIVVIECTSILECRVFGWRFVTAASCGCFLVLCGCS